MTSGVLRNNADSAITFEDRIGHVVEGRHATGSRGCMDVLGLQAHSAHHFYLPFAIFESYKRRTIQHRSQAGRLTLCPRHHTVKQSHGDYRQRTVGYGSIISNRGENNDSASKKNDDKLK